MDRRGGREIKGSDHSAAADDARNCGTRCILTWRLLAEEWFPSVLWLSAFLSRPLNSYHNSWFLVLGHRLTWTEYFILEDVIRTHQWLSYDTVSLLFPEGPLHFFSVTTFIKQRRNPFFELLPWNCILPTAPCNLNSRFVCYVVYIDSLQAWNT